MENYPRETAGLPHSSYAALFYERSRLSTQCGHRFAGVVTVVVRRVQDGHAAQCLLCDAVGLARRDEESARRALFDEQA